MPRRLLLVLVFAAFLVLGAFGRLVVLRLDAGGPVGQDLPQPVPPAAAPATPPSAGVDAPPADSDYAHFAADAAYPLDRWQRDEALAGAVTHVSIAGPRPAALDQRELTPADVLLVSGWAGEPVLGMRASHVLLSLCGQVFAATAVDLPLPSVRRFVHPNLTDAGWAARLPVAALPSCVDDEPPLLRAWAARDGRILYPLEGVTALTPPTARPLAAAVPPGRPPLRPEDLPPLERRVVEVGAAGAGLRRCPAADCAGVGHLEAGAYESVLLEHRGRWTLLVADDQAGWLADEQFDLAPLDAPATVSPEPAAR